MLITTLAGAPSVYFSGKIPRLSSRLYFVFLRITGLTAQLLMSEVFQMASPI